MSEIDYSSYSRVTELIDTTHRVAKPIVGKPTEKVSQVKPIVQLQSVRPTITTAPPQDHRQCKTLKPNWN